jgi:hypothetical protein
MKLLYALAGALALALCIDPATAQTAAPAAQPTFFDTYILPVIAMGVSAIVGWVATAVTKLVGVKIEESHRQALQTALTNAAALVAQKGMDFAIAYVKQSAGDAVKKFGLTDVDLAPKIQAKAAQLPPKAG